MKHQEDDMKEKILITSALPYANGPLHFGHIAGAYLPGDVYARFQRLKGSDVLYICGSDEYGVAITLSADIAKRSPKDHVDMFHAINLNFFNQLNFSFDHYSRTTWPGHVAPVQQFFKDLCENGYIEERITDQLYSEADGRFLADRYVVGTCPKCGYENARGDECPSCGASFDATDLKNPRSKLTKSPLVLRQTKHWFLLLDKFKDRLTEWVDSKNWKPNVSNFIKGFIKELHPRAITRDSTWGVPIPLPDTEGKVLYVWFDAPIGYVSATMDWAQKIKSPDRWKDYWLDPSTKLVHFIGKDNIPFHGAIFPAMVMGQNVPLKLVDELPANEFYNLEGRQFSKSDGWYIDLEDFFTKYTPDQIRYAIAANAPETQDSEFTWKDFQNRCNAELLGKYGNLVNRVLTFAHKNTDGKVPEMKDLQPIDEQFLEKIKALKEKAADAFANYHVRRASQIIMELAQEGNAYFDHKQPWKEAKSAETLQSMKNTVGCCLECLKTLAVISYPIIPTTAAKVFTFLGYHHKPEKWDVLSIPEGQKLKQPEILFRKVEDEEIEREIEKLKSLPKPKNYKPMKPQITIDDMKKVDLRVATITQAEEIPKSNKLLKLTADLGFETRTIVSGIKAHYKPQDVIGKKVVVVANLKPAKIAGVESQGMILAAGNDDALVVVTADGSEAGSEVT